MPKGVHDNHPKASGQHRWKPGGSVASNGYVKIRVGKSHPLADTNGYAYEHAIVWASAGKTPPSATEIIHHINGDKTDNRIENLEVMRRYDHSVMHHATLTDDEVVEVRTEYASGNANMPELAKRYNVSVQRVSKIVRGQSRLSAGGPIKSGRLLDGRTWDEYPAVQP